MLRKILGIEKIPEYDKTVGIIPVERGGVEIIGVGIKKDYRFEDGTEGI